MVDKTTEGVVAQPEEVEAVLHNLCGYHLSERDPLHRYNVLTQEQVLYDALVAAIRRERGRALAELVESGYTMTHVAAMTNLRTRQRVQRLIAIAKAADEAVAKVQAASREFEARLAAVEAALDEVHNGPAASATTEPPAQREEVSTEPVSNAPGADAPDTSGTGRADVFGTEVPVIAGAPGMSRDRHGDGVPLDESGYEDGAGWPGQPGPDGDLGFDPAVAFGTPEPDTENGGVLEPTIALPALTAALSPTRELREREEEPRWWRRSRSTGTS